MTGQRLTAAQNRVYNAVRRFIEANGYSPSYREIAAEAGLRSISTVHTHLTALEARGWVKLGDRKARAIRIVT